ncbi:MAG: hypothetical protein [Wendovervirus sonii]|uniref:Uncharacterized protein n=1 Tax=phage Lak_Megaphage_Sonny TaxID=3109229 RepID=A0ABZ0Z533_9CAUD|nr:MAG: hypothetical protein [phage Lak_Megaphage_Sonny]
MTNYIYDINYGHYRPLNEDDNTQNTQDNQNTQNTDQNQNNDVVKDNSLQHLETEDVLKIRQEKANKVKNSDDIILQKNKNILQLQQQIDAALKGSQPTNNLQKTLLQAQKELCDAKFEKSKIEHDMDNKILQAQMALVESLIVDTYPTRYKNINEDELLKCKIYLNTLIENDPLHIVNEMEDFKKIMGRANLLYGKDYKGYFAICVDYYDLNRLTTVLEKAGFLKESINGCCYSQMYL